MKLDELRTLLQSEPAAAQVEPAPKRARVPAIDPADAATSEDLRKWHREDLLGSLPPTHYRSRASARWFMTKDLFTGKMDVAETLKEIVDKLDDDERDRAHRDFQGAVLRHLRKDSDVMRFKCARCGKAYEVNAKATHIPSECFVCATMGTDR